MFFIVTVPGLCNDEMSYKDKQTETLVLLLKEVKVLRKAVEELKEEIEWDNKYIIEELEDINRNTHRFGP